MAITDAHSVLQNCWTLDSDKYYGDDEDDDGDGDGDDDDGDEDGDDDDGDDDDVEYKVHDHRRFRVVRLGEAGLVMTGSVEGGGRD